MIRTKVILVFTTSLILIVTLLGVHLFETSKEVYLHKRLDSMHHEYITVLNIKHAVSSQVKEAMNNVVFGFSGNQIQRYGKTKKQAESAIQELMATISKELGYIFVHEKEKEEGESRKAQNIFDKYSEIDAKLGVANDLLSRGSDLQEVKKILVEVEGLYESFVVLIEEWIEHEQQELQNVETIFSSMTDRNTMILIIGAVFTILFAMTMSLSIILLIIDPRLKELIRGTERVAKGDLDTPIVLAGRDEFTFLSKAFNQMMEQLQSSQKKLLEQSYYSGMAEMVSGILHNIKNSFSPFIIDTEIIYHHVKNIKLKQIGPTLAELEDATIDAGRRKDLLDLSNLLLANSEDILEKVGSKLADMQNRASLIERIIEEQSELANSQRLIEEVSLNELIHDSLSLIKKDFLEKVPVIIFQNVQAVGSIKTQRIVLLQVFSNIILNAIESILRSQNTAGKVQVHAAVSELDEQEMIHVTIIDDGEGIQPEQLQEIFQRGISGKAKRSGLGLHWCANSISALQGRLYAESEGLGTGAHFHLFLKRNL